MKNLIMNTIPICFSLSFKMKLAQINSKGFHTGENPDVPVMIYPNAELQEKQIKLDNKGKAGIYR
jgi:hypothetical protein